MQLCHGLGEDHFPDSLSDLKPPEALTLVLSVVFGQFFAHCVLAFGANKQP